MQTVNANFGFGAKLTIEIVELENTLFKAPAVPVTEDELGFSLGAMFNLGADSTVEHVARFLNKHLGCYNITVLKNTTVSKFSPAYLTLIKLV